MDFWRKIAKVKTGKFLAKRAPTLQRREPTPQRGMPRRGEAEGPK